MDIPNTWLAATQCGDCGAIYDATVPHTCPSTIVRKEAWLETTLPPDWPTSDGKGCAPSWSGPDAVIAEAMRVTSTDRHDQYAPPEQNFDRIASVWSGLLDGKLTEPVTAADVARLMVGMKLVRDAHKPQADNRVDAIGYLRCLERTEPTWEVGE